MVKRFYFKVGDDVKFQGDLETNRCQGICKNGQQCKRNVTIGLPYCWTHLESNKHLKIKKSTIPDAGQGVFAKDKLKQQEHKPVFKSKDLITPYEGENITMQQKNQRYGNHTGPYAVQKTQTSVEDAALKRGIGSVINRGNRNKVPNAEFSYDARRKQMNIKARKNIYDNDEILIPYGNRYNMNDGSTHYTK